MLNIGTSPEKLSKLNDLNMLSLAHSDLIICYYLTLFQFIRNAFNCVNGFRMSGLERCVIFDLRSSYFCFHNLLKKYSKNEIFK